MYFILYLLENLSIGKLSIKNEIHINYIYNYIYIEYYITDVYITGTVRDNQSLLLALDDAVFTNGIVLRDYICLYRANRVQDLASIVNVFSSKSINIHNLNANGSWVIIQTDQDVSIKVDEIESFWTHPHALKRGILTSDPWKERGNAEIRILKNPVLSNC